VWQRFRININIYLVGVFAATLATNIVISHTLLGTLLQYIVTIRFEKYIWYQLLNIQSEFHARFLSFIRHGIRDIAEIGNVVLPPA
jgi:hypothetical protein